MAPKNKAARKAKRARRQGVAARKAPKTTSLSHDELRDIIAKAQGLSEDDQFKLTAAVDTLALLTAEIEAKGASIRRLKALLFGPKSERTEEVLARLGLEGGEENAAAGSGEQAPEAASPEEAEARAKSPAEAGDQAEGGAQDDGGAPAKEPNKRRKGHGRNGADAYTGAERVHVHHPTLCHKDPCPACQQGRVYRMKEPITLVRVTGVAPLSATVYELERLRCNLCGEIFRSPAPEGVGEERYDAKSKAMLALLKYGCGLPFYRLERLEASVGIPLPSGTQWARVYEAYVQAVGPVHAALLVEAAQGEVLYNDDTTMRVLDLDRALVGELLAETGEKEVGAQTDRTGCFTTGILSTREGRKVALFFTGPRHAGENLAQVLSERAAELGVPIQMCDALSRNTKGVPETQLAHCLAHARRKFVDVAESFPSHVAYVLTELSHVYHHDELAKERALGAPERLLWHKEHSEPVMQALQATVSAWLDDRQVEPNSGLGKAIAYLLGHWEPLTLFLKVPGAPLDNNACEQTLKRAILHRKNALFYRNLKGARVGDAFMSVIHTSILNGANPFDYLVAVQSHAEAVQEAPEAWLPWNYTMALESLAAQA